jgi:hypothetical protein
MKIVEFLIENPIDGTSVEHIQIDHGDGSFTSMTKAEYDRQQAEQSTPIVKDEPAAKK